MSIKQPMTAKEVEACSRIVGRHTVGGVYGLVLDVRANKNGVITQRAWRLRAQSGKSGKSFLYTLGNYPELSLLKARTKAADVLAKEINPIAEKKKAQEIENEEKARAAAALSLDAFALKYLETETRKITSEKDRKLSIDRWRKYLSPVIGEIDVADVKSEDLIKVYALMPESGIGEATVKKIKALVNKVFDAAVTAGKLEDNPQRSSRFTSLARGLPTIQTEERHHGALRPEEMPAFFAEMVNHILKLEALQRSSITARCLLFAILTNSRNRNATRARWDQFYFTDHTWVIPAAEMKEKNQGAHTVYLSEAAEALVKSMKRWSYDFSPYVFNSPHATALGNNAFSQFLKGINDIRVREGLPPFIDTQQSKALGEEIRVTQHGLARATYKTWSQTTKDEKGHRLDVEAVELSLHHKRDGEGGLGGAYERAEFIEERRKISELWAKYCLSATPLEEWEKVVSIPPETENQGG